MRCPECDKSVGASGECGRADAHERALYLEYARVVGGGDVASRDLGGACYVEGHPDLFGPQVQAWARSLLGRYSDVAST